MIRKYAPLLFAILLLLHCICIYFGMEEMRMASKLLLIPVLILYLASYQHKTSLLVYSGLVFSFIGDLVLSQQGEVFFLAGMLAFVCTHVCNMIFFIKLQKGILTVAWPLIIAVLLLSSISTIVLKGIKPNLGKFELPVYFYMMVISFMAITAVANITKPWLAGVAIRCLIPGAFLFVVSDSILAMNKFLWHEPMADIAVMLTYGAAQYFLVRGFIQVSIPKTDLV